MQIRKLEEIYKYFPSNIYSLLQNTTEQNYPLFLCFLIFYYVFLLLTIILFWLHPQKKETYIKIYASFLFLERIL